MKNTKSCWDGQLRSPSNIFNCSSFYFIVWVCFAGGTCSPLSRRLDRDMSYVSIRSLEMGSGCLGFVEPFYPLVFYKNLTLLSPGYLASKLDGI